MAFSIFLRHLSSRHRIPRRLSFSSSTPSQPPNPSTLSSRLSFVFDQIDQIEKDRADKDDTLQRIRTWRQSKKSNHQLDEHQTHDSPENKPQSSEELGFAETLPACAHEAAKKNEKAVELVHPWPEWIEFMERLVHQNYFDHRRRDEDKMVEGLGFDDSAAGVAEEVLDFVKDWKTVQLAVLNFGRDRFDIFRSFARNDIQMLVGYGCPSSDRKAVFSSKLLRKYVHLDEGDVCSACNLRTTCDKAYLVTNKEDEARTIDVVRVLLTYGFEYITGTVANKDLLQKKSTKTAIRKLLYEVVKLSSVPIDPNLPPPIIKKRPPKVKQPPPPPRRRIGRDDIEMKKGDWNCPKCDFMNFAKNSICLQCDAKRPKRQLLPGEWECPQCNFLNYRRNMACFHCEHKRPADEYTESAVPERNRGPTSRPERAVNREEVYNAWNFDFDDDESDGADVAAFEHADAPGTREGNTRSEMKAESTPPRGLGDDAYSNDRNPRAQSHDQRTHGTGFDDFEDEEDDDVDNYEIEDANRSQREETPSVNFSDIEGSLSEDDDDEDVSKNHRANSRSRNKSPSHGKRAFAGSDDDALDFGSDDDLPVHPKWKSSHVADFRPRDRAPRGQSRERDFDSDDDLSGSDSEGAMDGGFRSRAGRGNGRGSDRRDSRGGDSELRMNGRGYGGENVRDRRQAGRMDRQPRDRLNEYDDRSDRSNHFGNSGRGGRGGSGGYGRDDFREQRQGGRVDRQRFDERDNRSDRGNSFGNKGRGGRGGFDRQHDSRSDSARGSSGRRDDRSDSGNYSRNNGRGGRGSFDRQRSDKEQPFEEERPRRARVNVR